MGRLGSDGLVGELSADLLLLLSRRHLLSGLLLLRPLQNLGRELSWHAGILGLSMGKLLLLLLLGELLLLRKAWEARGRALLYWRGAY